MTATITPQSLQLYMRTHPGKMWPLVRESLKGLCHFGGSWKQLATVTWTLAESRLIAT